MAINNLFVGEEEFLGIQKSFDIKDPVVLDMCKYAPPELEYKLNKVPFAYLKGTDKVFCLDMSSSKRILILGSTGAGKSTLQASIADRFMKAGGLVSWFDLKGEFTKKYKPLQSKYANKKLKNRKTGETRPKYIFPTEKPQGFEMRSYRPVFLRNMMEKYGTKERLAKHEQLCQFGIGDLTKNDLFIFFEQLVDRNPRYYELIDILWEQIVKQRLDSWEKIFNFIETYEDFDKNAKRLLSRTLKRMQKNNVIGDSYERPKMIEDINEERLNVLNMKGMLNMPQANSPALMYVNIMLKKIYNAKIRGQVPKRIHNMIIVSEINKFCPRLGNTPTKDQFLKLLDLVRSARISMMVDTQDWKRIPNTIIEQSDYIFLPYNVDLENMVEIIKKILPQEYENPHDFKPKLSYWNRRMKKLKDGRRDWLMLDRKDKAKFFVQPVMPISYLTEESDSY